VVIGHENYRCDYGNPKDACTFAWATCTDIGEWSLMAYAIQCAPQGEGGSSSSPDIGGAGGPGESGMHGTADAGATGN
jgi:hypothetical protein